MSLDKLQQLLMKAIAKLNRQSEICRIQMKIAFLIDEIEEIEEKIADIKTSLYTLDNMLSELYMKELKGLSMKRGKRG